MARIPVAAAAGLVTGGLSGWVGHLRRVAALWAVAGLFALTAYALGVAALATWLAQEFGMAGALLATAALAAILALAVAGIIRLVAWMRARKRRGEESRNLLYAAALAAATPVVARHGRLAILAAVAGGVGLALLSRGQGRVPAED